MLGEHRGSTAAADYRDEHEQCDTNILCWLHGWDPFAFSFVPSHHPVSVGRPAGPSGAGTSTSRSRSHGRSCWPHANRQGVWGLLASSGLGLCTNHRGWPTPYKKLSSPASPAPASAAVPVCRTVGAAPWGGPLSWSWLMGFGLGGYRRVTALPPSLGPGRPGRRRAGAHLAAGGAPGWRAGSPRRGVCGRPAGPGSGCALPAVIHVWAHPAPLAARTHDGRPLRLPAAVGEDTPDNTLATGVARRIRAGKCAPTASPRLFDCPQAVSRAPGRGQRTQGSPTGPCRPGRGRLPVRSSPGPAAPGRGRPHPRGLQRQTAGRATQAARTSTPSGKPRF